jgi:hypothetical protein
MTLFGPEIWLSERSKELEAFRSDVAFQLSGSPQLGLNKQEANYGIKISTGKPHLFMMLELAPPLSPSSAKTAMMSIYHGVCILYVWQVEDLAISASIVSIREGKGREDRKKSLDVLTNSISMRSAIQYAS